MNVKLTTIEEIKSFDDETNMIIGEPEDMVNSYVNFAGVGNVLFIEDGVRMDSCSINFLRDKSVVYLSSNRHVTKVKADLYNNNVFYLGKDANTTRPIHIICSEQKHVIIGDDCLFARDVWFRNGDPHLVYDANTNKRTNLSRSILIGDHVWIGQNVMISKGTKIGSGSVIGSWSMTAGKRIPSNTVWGGEPNN